MATKSASNVAERKPVSTKASADMKGANGSAYGSALIAFLKEKAVTVSKVNVSLKEKLQGFYKFSDADFTAYFASTKAWREEIGKEAAKMGLSVTKYRAAAEGMDYVYTTISEFDRLARAVKTGWRPETDRMTWAAIRQACAMRLESEAKRAERESVKAELEKWAADTTADPEVKKANVVILNAKMKELAATAAPRSTTGSTTTTKTNFQIACEMLEKFPLQDMELVYAWLGKRIKDKSGGTPSVKTATTGGDPVQKAAPKPTEKKESEHATAAHAPKGKGKGKGKK